MRICFQFSKSGFRFSSSLSDLLFALIFTAISIPIQANEPQTSINTTETAPVIDGVLDDAAWEDATLITEFYQRNPVEGAVASEATEVYLTYDSNMLYVGARLYDRDVDAIVARELREDAEMLNEDLFSIAIDSLLDRKNAFVFYMNALGTKSDGRFENNDTASLSRASTAR